MALPALVLFLSVVHGSTSSRVVVACSAWLYQLCRGVETEPVADRQLAKSLGSGKNFPGRDQLNTVAKVTNVLSGLT